MKEQLNFLVYAICKTKVLAITSKSSDSSAGKGGIFTRVSQIVNFMGM